MPLNDLMVSQKDDVHRAVREAGLDPSDFRWTDHERFDGRCSRRRRWFTSHLATSTSSTLKVRITQPFFHRAPVRGEMLQKAGIWETQLHWVGFSALAHRLWATAYR